MKKFEVNVHLLALLSMFIWGMSYVWSKIVFEYYNPITTVFLRLVISSLFLFAYTSIFGKFEKIRKEHYLLLTLSTFFNPFLYFIGESFGLNRVSPTISSVIIATIPLFIPIVAYFTLGERFSKINTLGIILSFVGVLLIMLNKKFSLEADPLGVLFLFGAVASAIVYSILLKKLSNYYSSITIVTYQNSLGVLFFLPLFIIFDYHEFIQVKPNVQLVSSLLLLAIFASSIAFILFTTAVRKIGVSRSNIYTNLIPIFTGITSYIMLSEQFTWIKISGIFIVILGVILTQLDKLKQRPKNESNSIRRRIGRWPYGY